MAHHPSETDKARAIALVTNGCQQNRVAAHLGIDAKTLRKHYARELTFGTETLLAAVLGNLAQIAMKGNGLPAVAAAKYLLSCRGGYREHAVLGIEPGAGLTGLMLADSDNAREIIAMKLDQLAAKNKEISEYNNGVPRAPLDS